MMDHLLRPSDRLSYMYSQLKRKWGRYRYKHAVHFNMRLYKWDSWYPERYGWMMSNIADTKRNVWFDCDVFTYTDRYTMPEHWVKGSIRFRRSEDKVMFLLRWA